MRQLVSEGHDVGFWSPADKPDRDTTLVFDAWTLFPTTGSDDTAHSVVAAAQQARAAGARVVVDNCDNQFAAVAPTEAWQRGLDRLAAVSELADEIVTCSATLGSVLRERLPSKARFTTIDDPVEDRIWYPGDARWKAWLSPSRQRAWMRAAAHAVRIGRDRMAGRTPLVWFGSHGNDFSAGGMLDLLPRQALLEHIGRQFPVSLTIISNHEDKFRRHFGSWGVPVHYLAWDRNTFVDVLRLHAVSLLPSVDNDFTRCKSSNRLVHSLHHGLAVMADAVPSYQPFSAFAQLGNWEDGLPALLGSAAARNATVRAAQEALLLTHGLDRIAAQWLAVLFRR